MKRSFYALFMTVLFVSMTETSHASTLVKIVKSKKLQDNERNVSDFKGIASSGSYDVRITMGNKETLRLEGDDDLIKEIETVVENGILKIRNKKKHTSMSWRNLRGKVTVYITAKSLNSITLSGSGDISVKGTVKADRLTNTLSGSGSISLTADADEYVGAISGSGEIEVRGSANRASIKIGGSGDFEGSDFRTSEAEVKISGSGNAEIRADKSLTAAVSGSGNITYSGNPRVSKSKSGSGSISKL